MENISSNSRLGKRSSNKFSTIFIFAALILMLTPFISTFNNFLTNLFLKWEAYRLLDEFVVPYQAKVIAATFSLLRLSSHATTGGVWLGGYFLELEWNCLGWQSAVLLLASFLTGFQGKFSNISRLETIMIGFLGTYLLNILRLLIFGFLVLKTNLGIAYFFHDYLALILVISWFFIFWWFSYSYVLEEREFKRIESQ